MALGAKPTLSVQYCDDPQLTSVSELSEQKLGLVTLTTCRLISAAALRKNTRTQTAARGARGRCRRKRFVELLLSVQCSLSLSGREIGRQLGWQQQQAAATCYTGDTRAGTLQAGG